jgi:DNA topoisomerase-1
VKTEQKFTQPPPRFNDASLVKELEKRGIGRPSTYASIISTIMDRGYVERQQRRFFATKVGMAVVDFLLKNFPKEMDFDFTAKMEDELDDIARGKLKWNKMLSVFYGPFEEKVKEVTKDADRVEIPVEKLGKPCPECKEGELVIREGRYGKFISCSRFPDCKYKDKYIEYIEGAKCEKCGSRVVVKKTRFGKEFYGCETYPKCDWATWKKPVVEGQEEVVEKVEEKEEEEGE